MKMISAKNTELHYIQCFLPEAFELNNLLLAGLLACIFVAGLPIIAENFRNNSDPLGGNN
jgi:hypothetical protein